MRTLLLAVALTAVAALPSASAQSIAGTWDAAMETPGGTRTFQIVFEVHGDSLSGTVRRPAGDSPLTGTIRGDTVRFSYTIIYADNPLVLTMVATVTGDTMKGIVDMNGMAEEPFSARRAGVPPGPA